MLTKYEIEEEKEDKFTSYVDQSELLNDAIRYYETLNVGPYRFSPRELAQIERSVGTNISSCYIEEIEENIPF